MRFKLESKRPYNLNGLSSQDERVIFGQKLTKAIIKEVLMSDLVCPKYGSKEG